MSIWNDVDVRSIGFSAGSWLNGLTLPGNVANRKMEDGFFLIKNAGT
jgi:hypothetical protein